MSANIVSVDEESLRNDIKNLVRKTVEETLNALLDEEASELVGAERYERTAGREAYRSGHYTRRLVTGAGEVELSVPELRGATFQTAVIERYRRRETSVEEAIVEMYLAGVSTRRIEDVSELLWGAPVSSGTVSNLNERAFASIETWRQRPLEGGYPYVFVDGIYLKRSWGGSYENVAVPVAIGVNSAGDREVIGCSEGYTEPAESWREFFSWLKGRGLSGVRLVTGDKCAGMLGALEEVFPGGPLPALHGAFLPQRAGKGSRDQAEGRGAHAEGDPRAGIARGMRRKSRGGGGGAGIDEARGGREDGARRVRRDACLHGIPTGALAPDQDEQRDRAHQPRDQEEDEGRRDLPRRQFGSDVGDGEAEVHSGARVGQEEVLGHVEAGGDGRAEGKGGGLEEDGAGDG